MENKTKIYMEKEILYHIQTIKYRLLGSQISEVIYYHYHKSRGLDLPSAHCLMCCLLLFLPWFTGSAAQGKRELFRMEVKV